MYKLVAIDLDGTLLNSQKTISDQNATALKAAAQAGVDIVICSGRIYKGAMIFARLLELKGEIISCNGAIIRDVVSGELLQDIRIEKDDCTKILEILRDENLYFHAYIADTMYAKERGYGTVFYEGLNAKLPLEHRVDIRLINELDYTLDNNTTGASKFVVACKDLCYLKEVRALFDQMPGVDTMSSSFDNFEIVRNGVSKGKALEFLCSRKGICRDEVMAIGDNENDFSMIEFAGMGVAMGNATDYIKSSANYITLGNNEDGVAEAIKRFIL